MAQNFQQIAVVTNDPTRIEAINQIVNPHGWGLAVCVGQEQPLIWLMKQTAGVILVDLDLEDPLGFITQCVQALPTVPVIALAAPERLVMLQPILLAGARDFIAMPLNAQHFMTVVTRTIEKGVATDSMHSPSGFLVDGNGQSGYGSNEQPIPIETPESQAQNPAFPPAIYQRTDFQQNDSGDSQAPHGGASSQVPVQRQNYTDNQQMAHRYDAQPHPAENGVQPLPPPMPKQRLIAVVGLRGGVGRSTVAVNLAVALQQRDMGNVILAEAHHGLSHLSLMLHLHPRNTLAGLNDDVAIDADIVNGHLQAHSSGIKVLAAPAHLDDLVELSGERWSDICEILPQISPIVVVDTATIADAALLEVLVHADSIIVVMTPDIASLRNATALTKSLYEEAEVQGKVDVILNRSSIGGGLDEATIRKQLGHELTVSLPDDTSLATYAMNRGVPFVNSHPKALLTKRINALADHLFQGAHVNDGHKESSTKTLLPFMNLLRSS